MKKQNVSAVINKQTYGREYVYDETTVLTASIESFIVDGLKWNAEERINVRIFEQQSEFMRYNKTELFPQAVETYKDSVENGFPIRPYEAVLNYAVTYNEKGLLSTYRDNYAYTGGAHGNTVRKSDTYDLSNGAVLPLSAFFHGDSDYQRNILDEILKQAEQDHEYYFENYAELIVQYFNPESYYLTPDGIAIYYQQYEIAPYSTGIVVFILPWN